MRKFFVLAFALLVPCLVQAQDSQESVLLPFGKEVVTAVIACFSPEAALKIAESYTAEGEVGSQRTYLLLEGQKECTYGRFHITFKAQAGHIVNAKLLSGVGGLASFVHCNRFPSIRVLLKLEVLCPSRGLHNCRHAVIGPGQGCHQPDSSTCQ